MHASSSSFRLDCERKVNSCSGDERQRVPASSSWKPVCFEIRYGIGEADGSDSVNTLQAASSHSIAQRRAADTEKQEMLSKLRSTATQAGSGARAGAGAGGAAPARRSFSLGRNLSQHLDHGSPAVPVSARLPAPTLNGRTNSEDEAESASAVALSEATEEGQVGGSLLSRVQQNI